MSFRKLHSYRHWLCFYASEAANASWKSLVNWFGSPNVRDPNYLYLAYTVNIRKHLQIRSLVACFILSYWSEFSVDHPSYFRKASSLKFNFWVYAWWLDWYLNSEWELTGCIRGNRSHSVIRELMQDLPCNDLLFRKCVRRLVEPLPRTSVSLTLNYTMTHWFCVPAARRTSILIMHFRVRD